MCFCSHGFKPAKGNGYNQLRCDFTSFKTSNSTDHCNAENYHHNSVFILQLSSIGNIYLEKAINQNNIIIKDQSD